MLYKNKCALKEYTGHNWQISVQVRPLIPAALHSLECIHTGCSLAIITRASEAQRLSHITEFNENKITYWFQKSLLGGRSLFWETLKTQSIVYQMKCNTDYCHNITIILYRRFHFQNCIKSNSIKCTLQTLLVPEQLIDPTKIHKGFYEFVQVQFSLFLVFIPDHEWT